jgi:spore coat protein E
VKRTAGSEKNREIITKAICGTAKKDFRHTHYIDLPKDIVPDQILGCSVTQLRLQQPKVQEKNLVDRAIEIGGSYEVHIWYALNNGKTTDVLRCPIDFKDSIQMDYYDHQSTGLFDIRTTVIKSPRVLESVITKDNRIKLVLELGIYVEVVGETKITVRVLVPENDEDDD